MLLNKELKFDLDDISIVPKIISEIESRTLECNPLYDDGFLPIFTAPMSSVINEENIDFFTKNKIKPILPRTVDYSTRIKKSEKYFSAFGLNEFGSLINNGFPNSQDSFTHYILIDIANGHMKKLFDLVEKAKSKWGDKIQLMVGNVAHPYTYKLLSEAGADYCRVGIGNGGACTTSANVCINYPNGSLITECAELKVNLNLSCKIIADGGMKNYSDIIKSLALGADYVMVGSIFNKALESAGKTYYKGDSLRMSHNGELVSINDGKVFIQYLPETRNYFLIDNLPLYKEYYGMSTKKAQMEMGKEKLRTAEGIIKEQKVEYTLDKWCENFIDYLTSTMSYCGYSTLEKYIGNADYIFITQNALNRFKK